MVYAKWKGRNYVRQLVTPNNPKSAKQTGIRCMMAWLAANWANVSAPDKATWAAIAVARSVSQFNAYTGENLDRWQCNTTPGDMYPAEEVLTTLGVDIVADDGVILSATGHAGYAALTALPDTTANAHAVAVIIFRSSAAPTPISWANAIKIINVTPGTVWTYDDSPLDAATYHYKIAYMSEDGCVSALSAADDDAVVT